VEPLTLHRYQVAGPEDGAAVADGSGAALAAYAVGWAADGAGLIAGDSPRTKVSVVPVGKEMCWPVAAAATLAGALTW
jgi:hypothetical protein